MDFLTSFETFSAFVPATIIIAQYINTAFSISKKIWKQVVSWAIPIIMSVVGLVLQAGMFVSYGTVNMPMAWVMTVLTGFAAGLVSNGVYEINVVKNALKYVTEYVKNYSKQCR